MQGMKVKGTRDNYRTPDYLFNHYHEIFNFEMDGACTSEDSKLENGYFIDQGYDALELNWFNRTWCNPPFSLKNEFLQKAHDEVLSGNCPLCVMVYPLNAISNSKFHELVVNKFHYEFLENRVGFINPETGKVDSSNNTGTVVIFFMNKPKGGAQK